MQNFSWLMEMLNFITRNHEVASSHHVTIGEKKKKKIK